MPSLYRNADAKYTTEKAGGEVVDVRPGDVIWFEPGERHWHGTALNRMMAHLAVQRADEAGRTALWQEPVTDADYAGGTKLGSA